MTDEVKHEQEFEGMDAYNAALEDLGAAAYQLGRIFGLFFQGVAVTFPGAAFPPFPFPMPNFEPPKAEKE